MYLPKSTLNGKTVAISVSQFKARRCRAKDKSTNMNHSVIIGHIEYVRVCNRSSFYLVYQISGIESTRNSKYCFSFVFI